MDDLLKRLEEATEGSRELDRLIAIHPATPSCGVVKGADIEVVREAEEDWNPPVVVVPDYTTNLQDALGLVPEGCPWEMKSVGMVEMGTEFGPVEGIAATPALALCIASLRAIEARAEKPVAADGEGE